MKKIKLETYKFIVRRKDKNGQLMPFPVEVTDRELLKTPLENVTLGGKMNIAELRKIDRVCNIIDGIEEIYKDDGTIETKEHPKDELLLEDADFGYLKKRFNEYLSWLPGEIRKYVLKAADKLEKPEEVKAEEGGGGKA